MSDIRLASVENGFVELSGGTGKREVSDWELWKRVVKISAPVYPSALMGFSLGLVSAAAVGRLGDTTALAAVGLSNMMCNMLGFSWLWGLSAAISTLSSQDWGAQSFHSVGLNLQRGLLVCFCLADLPLIIMWLSSEHLLVSAGQPPDVAAYVGLYTRVRLPGIFCETITCCMGRTLTSIGNTKIGSSVAIVTATLNVCLTMTLVPKYGFIGAPITATICDVVQALSICAFGFRDADFQKCWPGFDKQAFKQWGSYLKIALPSFVLLVNEVWSYFTQDLLAGYISTVAMATNATMPQLCALLYVSGMSLSTGAGTVIGNLLGENRPSDAQRAGFLSMCALEVALLPQVATVLFFRQSIPSLFTQDTSVLQSMIDLIPYTLLFSSVDMHQAVLTGILSAAGKQSIAAPAITVCYWVVGVPLGVALAFGFITEEPYGLKGLWIGMITGVVLHTVSFAVIVKFINWPSAAQEVQERNASDVPLIAENKPMKPVLPRRTVSADASSARVALAPPSPSIRIAPASPSMSFFLPAFDMSEVVTFAG